MTTTEYEEEGENREEKRRRMIMRKGTRIMKRNKGTEEWMIESMKTEDKKL